MSPSECGPVELPVLVAWIGLAAIFVASGTLKLRSRNSMTSALVELGVTGASLQRSVNLALPLIEVIAALWLLTGWASGFATIVVLLLVAGFNATLWTLRARGYQGDCGCFGAKKGTAIQVAHLVRNAIMLAAALLLVVRFGPAGCAPGAIWSVPAGGLVMATFVVGLAGCLYVVAEAAERLLSRPYWR